MDFRIPFSRLKITLRRIERFVAMLANLAVILGIAFVVVQIKQTENLDKRRAAIEAVNLAKSKEFIDASSAILSKYRNREPMQNDTSIDQYNFVLTVYLSIASFYFTGAADECIIKLNVYSDVEEFSDVMDTIQSPVATRDIIGTFVERMQKIDCRKSL